MGYVPIGLFWAQHAWFEVLEWRIMAIDGNAVLRWAMLHRGRSLEIFALAPLLVDKSSSDRPSLLEVIVRMDTSRSKTKRVRKITPQNSHFCHEGSRVISCQETLYSSVNRSVQ